MNDTIENCARLHSGYWWFHSVKVAISQRFLFGFREPRQVKRMGFLVTLSMGRSNNPLILFSNGEKTLLHAVLESETANRSRMNVKNAWLANSGWTMRSYMRLGYEPHQSYGKAQSSTEGRLEQNMIKLLVWWIRLVLFTSAFLSKTRKSDPILNLIKSTIQTKRVSLVRTSTV